MFGIFKRLTRLEKEVLAVSLESGDTLGMVYDLEKQVTKLKEQLDKIDFNNGFLAMADRIAADAKTEMAKAAPKKKAKPVEKKKPGRPRKIK